MKVKYSSSENLDETRDEKITIRVNIKQEVLRVVQSTIVSFDLKTLVV